MASTARLEMLVDLKDEVSKGLQTIGGSLEGDGKAAKVAAGLVATAGAAAIAYAGVAVHQFSEVGDEIQKMSIRTGIGAESISAFRVAAESAGTSLSAVEGGVRIMQKSLSDLSGDTKKGQEAFKALGLSFDDIQKMAPDQQFATIGSAIANLKDPAERTAASMALFGKSGTDLIPLFQDLGGSLDAAKQQAKDLGVSFDDVSANQAAQLNDALGYLKAAFLGVALSVGGELAPTITKLVQEALPTIKVLAEQLGIYLPIAIQAIIDIFGFLIETARNLWTVLNDSGAIAVIQIALAAVWDTIQNSLIPSWNSLMAVVEKNHVAFEAIAKFLGLVLLGAIIAIIAIIDVWIKIIATEIEWIGKAIDAWANFGENVKGVWTDVKNWVKGVIDSIVGWVQGMIDKFNEAIRKAKEALTGITGNISTSFKNLPANLGLAGARAEGGPVSAGRAYLVGENGPEAFVPGAGGMIVPAGAGGGAAGITINVSGNQFLGDPASAARAIGDELVKYLKLNQRL